MAGTLGLTRGTEQPTRLRGQHATKDTSSVVGYSLGLLLFFCDPVAFMHE